jgi:class 3 adenylate cyclase/tetratricopeptide (TPR) repeat protein
MTCPACGVTAPDDARFCPSCGHALVTRPDERRVATVLFADLVGFTTFSESADPEHVKHLVDVCFEHLVADVDTFGGQIDKIVGDAIVALFGAPVAHEDDAERAVRAALRMQSTLAELRDKHGIAAELRIGVNTGEVLVGALRAGGDYTAMGDVVNTASRLQAVAEPGSVVVGPATHAATHNGVRYEQLGPLAVKGREEPVEAWVALEALAPPGQRPARARSPLVGRDTEVEIMRSVLRSAIERRRAHLLLIAGEAGVGKTRLARELGVFARREHGAEVLLGHCAPYGEANVWFPVAEALRQACAIDDADPAATARSKCARAAAAATGLAEGSAELRRVEEGLLYLLGQGGPGSAVDPARARDDALRSVQAFFEGMARHRPLVLGLADLHWADDLVLELIDRLLLRLRNLPFLLVASTREDLEERWTPRPGRHNAVFVNLEPLDVDAGTQLARALLGPDVPDELVGLLLERSGGNPFFIEELVAVIAESGPEPAGGNLPGTLRGLVSARLDTLEPRERNTLEDCAIAGPSGTIDLVAALAGERGEHDPLRSLRLLAERDLIELDGESYTFRTELIREVTYGILTKAERARRHVALAHHLAARAEETGRIQEQLDQLAHHYGAAAAIVAELGPVEGVDTDLTTRATDFLERAAARAGERETWAVAARLLEMAVAIVEPADVDRRLRLLLARARARAELRECEGARHDVDEILAMAEQRGDAVSFTTALTVRGDVEAKENDFESSIATLRDAVGRWRELDDPAGLADALRLEGMTHLFRGELDESERAISEARASFGAVGDRRGEAWAIQNLAWIAFTRGHTKLADERLHQSASMFADIGDWGGLGWALGLLAWIRYNQGRLEESERLATQVLEEAVELAQPWAGAVMRVLLASIALWRGRSHQAVELGTAARATFAELPDPWGEMQALAPVSRAHACLGRFDDAYRTLDELAQVVQRVADVNMREMDSVIRCHLAVHKGDADALATTQAAWERFWGDDVLGYDEMRTVRGLALLQAGRTAEAVTELEAAHEAAREEGRGAASGVARALALDGAGRGEEARALCEELRGETVTYLDETQFELALGFALVQQGEVEPAGAAFDRAVRIVDASESRLDQAVTRLARAVAWEAIGAPDAPVARHEAVTRLDALGIDAAGWETAFGLAAHGPDRSA